MSIRSPIEINMRDIRFHINLYILIPVIFAGFTTLSFLVAYQLTRFYISKSLPPQWPLAFWGALLVIFTFACGLLVVKFVISPVERFVDKTQTMGVLKDIDSSQKGSDVSVGEINRFSRVFDQVTEILSKMEASALFPEIVGHSTAMRAVLNQIVKVAPTDSMVLVAGETGTGKELIAHAIHGHSRRRSQPFLALNCAAIPEGLLESELFGHEKGAFTGAVNRKIGKIEQAHQGTLFLDEIGDMSLETQAKLLRALEERQVVRLGGTQPVKVDVRFIAATNKNLPERVKKGLFREDLYYRLNVFLIHLPPLRERREDIPLLAEHFLNTIDEAKKLSTACIQRLMAHDWPGNVRELQNAIQSAAVMSGAEIVEPVHLPSAITHHWPAMQNEPACPDTTDATSDGQDLDHQLREFEKNMLIHALSQSRGIQKQAAKLLGIKERSLWHRLKKHDIDASVYKM